MPNPIEQLSRLATCWSDALFCVTSAAQHLGMTSDPLNERLARARVSELYRASLVQLQARIMIAARDVNLVAELASILDDLKATFSALTAYWDTPTSRLIRQSISSPATNPLSILCARLESTLDSLALYKPLLAFAVQRPPLTDAQSEIWEALRGNGMVDEELAKICGRKSTAAVRQSISSMRRQGYEILQKPGVGYYRPDAPPSPES